MGRGGQVVRELQVWKEKQHMCAGTPRAGADPQSNPYRYVACLAQQTAEMPALAFAATCVLGGLAAAIVNDEQVHPAEGIVNNKLFGHDDQSKRYQYSCWSSAAGRRPCLTPV